MIGPDGVFTTFAYRHGMALAAARRFRRALHETFDEVLLTPTVWRNMPPAFVYVCRRPRARVTGGAGRVPLREIARLAGPALPVLAAEPLYLLVDTAVVGRLGAVPLAGLAIAGVVFAQVTGQLNFLSYGTTARAARLHGAGRRAAAVGEGVQATWLALAVGLLVLGVGQLVAGPVARRSATGARSRPPRSRGCGWRCAGRRWCW